MYISRRNIITIYCCNLYIHPLDNFEFCEQSMLRQHIIGDRWRLVRRIHVAVDRVRNRGEIVAPTTRYLDQPRDLWWYFRGRTGGRKQATRTDISNVTVNFAHFILINVVANKSFKINVLYEFFLHTLIIRNGTLSALSTL